MHKKLEADLISLAHSILQMKNKDDVFALKEKSKEVYEKISMLAFVEEYVNTTPGLETPKEEFLAQVATAFEAKEKAVEEKNAESETIAEEKIIYNLVDEPETIEKEEIKEGAAHLEPNNEVLNQVQHKEVEEIIEQPFDELEDIMFAANETPNEVEEKLEEIELKASIISDVVRVEERKTMSLEEELQDTISVDFMADLFENAQPKSLNDKLAKNIQIGLNDRIAFVKNLFEGDQENYNRVVSQLNTFKSANDAKHFIHKMVKPDYNWSKQEELEMRFMEIIERKFA